jgi:hypothetical protein
MPMPSPPAASSRGLRLWSRPETVIVVFAAFLSYSLGGCLSNQYVIPKTELARLAQLPPEQRGQRVQVVQELGERRGEAIDGNTPPPAPGYAQGPEYGPPPADYVDDGGAHVGVGVIVDPVPLLPHHHGPRHGFTHTPGPGHGFAPTTAPRASAPMGRAAPGTIPAPRKPSTGGGGVGGLPKGGKGGGGSGKEELIVLAIVVAVLATIGMVATEGARYDGHVAMYPWQPVHLTDQSGMEREVPLAQLTPADVTSTRTARVMDDEGWGMMRLGRRPLDRKGFAFKLDFGAFHSSSSALDADGWGMNLQLGFFPHHMVGILGTWAFAPGSDALGFSYWRSSLAVEAQVFPLTLWRLHLGGFGHVGKQWVDDTPGGARDGLAAGGGLILEIGLTARLALTLRADYTSAKIHPQDGGWQAAELFTAGVAVY